MAAHSVCTSLGTMQPAQTLYSNGAAAGGAPWMNLTLDPAVRDRWPASSGSGALRPKGKPKGMPKGGLLYPGEAPSPQKTPCGFSTHGCVLPLTSGQPCMRSAGEWY